MKTVVTQEGYTKELYWGGTARYLHKALPIVYVTDNIHDEYEAYMPLCLEEAYIAVTLAHPDVLRDGLSVTVTNFDAFAGGMMVEGSDYYIMEREYNG